MGRDKAMLPFGPELMLQRVVRLMQQCVLGENIVVVAAPQQAVPTLPGSIVVVRDAREYLGPLAALATGLGVVASRIDAVYASACDAPLLIPSFVDHMFTLLDGFESAVPVDGRRYQPLAAVYRTAIGPRIHDLLSVGESRLQSLFDVVSTRRVPIAELRDVDPQLASLFNVNCAEDYDSALAAAGY
jgi:molybdopterin-guanine dinucleotide biosynthesis protein A